MPMRHVLIIVLDTLTLAALGLALQLGWQPDVTTTVVLLSALVIANVTLAWGLERLHRARRMSRDDD
ncbi:MAG: hypothetical protein KKA73_06270 [Chloroflexi bacterium]|nr:hypothetical protein [Chloroflexota bacterium]MBU1747275.1 hypothetical protein [Chloroflexota bacterium]